MDRAFFSPIDRDRLLRIYMFVCPAVIGDRGKMYVPQDVVPVYRSMLPLATIITPNYFELESAHSNPYTELQSTNCSTEP